MSDGHTVNVHKEYEQPTMEKEPSQLPKGQLGLVASIIDNELSQKNTLTSHVSLASVSSIRINLQVMIPVACFRLHTLYSLAPGSVVPTVWLHSEDLPVSAENVRLAWAEFAITGHRRSVRVTRIS